MGHIRVGRIPKTRNWRKVISLFDSTNISTTEIASATAEAAKDFFIKNRSDSTLAFTYWLLTQITYRARNANYLSELKTIGLDISNVKTVFEFLGRVTNYTNQQISLRGENFPISEFARLSFNEVLTETIGHQYQSLFGLTYDDIQKNCAIYSNPNNFAKLARLFFSKVINRSLQFFISKESCNRIGNNKRFEDIETLSNFNGALETYCYQSSKIVEDFAKGWYSKRNWLGGITEKDARGFVSIAVQKLSDEIAHEEKKDKISV